MKALLAVLALLCLGAGEEPPPTTYLVSLTGIPLPYGQRISAFEIKTWGVTYLAVCRMPEDWEVTAGSFGPDGRLSGEAGHGAAYLDSRRLNKMHRMALIALSGPVQKRDKRIPDGRVPATFAGHITIDLGEENKSRKQLLTSDNVALEPARECPARR